MNIDDHARALLALTQYGELRKVNRSGWIAAGTLGPRYATAAVHRLVSQGRAVATEWSANRCGIAGMRRFPIKVVPAPKETP